MTPSRTPRRSTSPPLRGGDLAEIVRHYRAEFQDDAARELHFFAMQPSFQEAISRAALAQRPDGKRFSHQRRIPQSALEHARRLLLQAHDRLAEARDFDALFRVVEAEIAPIHKIGPLTVYDTTLRIAAWRGLEPDKVYLHAGTRDGAQALGLDHHGKRIPIEALPSELRRLAPREIEDVLCIYKDALRRRRTPPPGDRCT